MNFRILYTLLALVSCSWPDHKADCGHVIECNNGDIDGDGDGYCSNNDCWDGNCDVNPGATEICDGLDNDCDGLIDGEDKSLKADDDELFDVYADQDRDSYCDGDPIYQECRNFFSPEGGTFYDPKDKDHEHVLYYCSNSSAFSDETCTDPADPDHCYSQCLMDCCADGTEDECESGVLPVYQTPACVDDEEVCEVAAHHQSKSLEASSAMDS